MLGGLMTTTLALLPFAFHLAQRLDVSKLSSLSQKELVDMALGQHGLHAYVFFLITTLQRVCLIGLFFFMMCVAERTYKQVSAEVFFIYLLTLYSQLCLATRLCVVKYDCL